MPLIKINNDTLPSWGELDDLRIMSPEKKIIIKITSPRFVLFAVKGSCKVNERLLKEEEQISGTTGDLIITPDNGNVQLVLAAGRWTDPIGNSGIFKMNNSSNPGNEGDPVDYERTTHFDNHFHDCDEFWVITEGKGLAVSEGIPYFFCPGDCIATKMGDHHDLPYVFEEIKGVYIETTLKGKKRSGHLWNHKHGLPSE